MPRRKRPIYVIQKHHSSRLHYDLRLEIDGVLKSWAMPKGPSLDPIQKRLAIETEDHPLEYARFEGVIPEGLYGAGTVMVWDSGTFRNLQQKNHISLSQAYKKGRLEIWLEGEKLQGGYVLIKMKGKENQWLLIKIRDKKANATKEDVLTLKPNSALSGKDLDQIKRNGKSNPPPIALT